MVKIIPLGEVEGIYIMGMIGKKISAQIIERDGFACKRCGIKQDELPKNWRLQVHHKKKLRDCKNLEEANNPSNLDTLCNKCHGIVEHHGIDY